jgi:hypothetical protein
MSDVGYDTFNLVLNLGTLALLLFAYFIKVAYLFLILGPLSFVSDRAKKWYVNTKKALFFGDLIVLFIEGYMEFLISSMLILKGPEQPLEYQFMVKLAYFFLFVTIFIIPGLYLYILSLENTNIWGESFFNKFGMLYEGGKKNKYALFHFLYFVLRRLLFILAAFTMDPYPAI